MKRMFVTVVPSFCLLLAFSGTVQAQLPVATMNNKMPSAMAYNYYNYNAAQANAYRSAMSRTQRAGVQSIRYNATPVNYGLAPLTTGINSLMMMNGMIPGASAYQNQNNNNNTTMNQGYNPYMNQGYNPYMNQGYNPYINQGYNPYYMMNPYGN